MTLLTLPIIVGIWSYLFTHELVQPGEVFAFIGRGVNKTLTGNENIFANPDDHSGLKLALWKWTYCEKCHAGIVGAALAAVMFFDGISLTDCFMVAVLSMFTALAAKRLIKGV